MANFQLKTRSERAGLSKRTTPVTPWDPSRRATARVPDPLPTPHVCHHCGGHIELVNNQEIYGKPYGQWPWAYLCRGCGAHVGIHPYTNIALGFVANFEERVARKLAKDKFNKLWRGDIEYRNRAYAWLASQMGIPRSECHFGMFGVDQCTKALEIMNQRKRNEPI